METRYLNDIGFQASGLGVSRVRDMSFLDPSVS